MQNIDLKPIIITKLLDAKSQLKDITYCGSQIDKKNIDALLKLKNNRYNFKIP